MDESGAPADFLRFFEVTFPRMLAGALMLSGNRPDAEDAVQEAYAEALARWDRISTYDSPEAWVHRVMRQRVWKASRRWRRLSSLESMELAGWCGVKDNTERAVEARAALAALAELPHRQRVVMVMLCVAGVPQHEIADELDLSYNAVRQAIFKARRTLSAKLARDVACGHTDALAPATGPAFLDAGAGAGDDWLVATLRAAESWLREGIEANNRGRDQLRQEVLARAARWRWR